MKNTIIPARLADFALFANLVGQEEKFDKIAHYLTVKQFGAGEYILNEGDLGDELYILVEGSVRVLKHTKNKEEYTLVDLKSESNVFFGEVALMDAEKRSASIMVLEDCVTYVMDRAAFLDLGAAYPEIALPITRAIAKIISGRLRTANDDVILLFDALVNEVETTQL